jgi:small multidrug resistance pump
MINVLNASVTLRASTIADPHSVEFSASYGSTESDKLFSNHANFNGTLGDDSDSPHADGNGGGIYWIYLFIAIFFELAGTRSMKLSDGFANLLPSILIYIFYGLSFVLFPLSMKGIELSIAYAIWSGVGTTMTCVIGFYFFNETMNLVKIIALVAIIGGCAVLKSAEAE